MNTKYGPILNYSGNRFRFWSRLEPILGPHLESLRSGKLYWVEPFLGAGGTTLRVMPKRAFLSDRDPWIIETWLTLAKSPEALILELEKYKHLNLEEAKSIGHRYTIERLQPHPRNLTDIAEFVIFSRLAYNGKRDSRGISNEELRIWNSSGFERISKRIRWISNWLRSANVQFQRADAIAVIRNLDPDPNLLLYLDPPYLQKHIRYGFGEFGGVHDYEALLKELRRGFRFVLHASDDPDTRKLFKSFRLHFQKVNSLGLFYETPDGSKRKQRSELLAWKF